MIELNQALFRAWHFFWKFISLWHRRSVASCHRIYALIKVEFLQQNSGRTLQGASLPFMLHKRQQKMNPVLDRYTFSLAGIFFDLKLSWCCVVGFRARQLVWSQFEITVSVQGGKWSFWWSTWHLLHHHCTSSPSFPTQIQKRFFSSPLVTYF